MDTNDLQDKLRKRAEQTALDAFGLAAHGLQRWLLSLDNEGGRYPKNLKRKAYPPFGQDWDVNIHAEDMDALLCFLVDRGCIKPQGNKGGQEATTMMLETYTEAIYQAALETLVANSETLYKHIFEALGSEENPPETESKNG